MSGSPERRRVMVVDDDADIRDFVLMVLVDEGYDVLAAPNGQVALAFYSLDPDEDAYMPFALNVLTFRGPEISEVDAFIVRTPTAPDRATAARMPEQPTNAEALAAAFENLGMPERMER